MIGDIERAQRDYRIAGQLGMDCSSALRRLAGLAADRSRRSRLAYEPVQEDQDQEDSPPKTPYKLANYSYEEPGGTDDVEADGYGQDAAIAPQPPVLPIGMTSLNSTNVPRFSTNLTYSSLNRSNSAVGTRGSRGRLPDAKPSRVNGSHPGNPQTIHRRVPPHYVGQTIVSRPASHLRLQLPATGRNAVHFSRLQPVSVHPVMVRYPYILIRLHR